MTKVHPPRPSAGSSVAPLPVARRHRGIFIFLYFILPATQGSKQVTLNYSQFLHDVSAQKVKTVTIQHERERYRHLDERKQYTTAIPRRPGQSFLDELQNDRCPDHRRDHAALPSAQRCCRG